MQTPRSTYVGIPEREQKTGCSDFDGDRNGIGVEVIPAVGRHTASEPKDDKDHMPMGGAKWKRLPNGETKRRVDPARGKVGERAGDGGVRGHLADGAQRGVRRRADERIRDECPKGPSYLQRFAGSQEETRAQSASDLRVDFSPFRPRARYPYTPDGRYSRQSSAHGAA